jgi:fatty acid desaturase
MTAPRPAAGIRALAWWSEMPTILVGLGAHVAWIGLQLLHGAVPLAAYLVASALLGVLGLSLQHEAVHGHPFRSRRANAVFAVGPLTLWLPFSVYRRTHLAHHATGALTDPLDDPESAYVAAATWLAAGRVRRAVLVADRTLLGRLLVGPMRQIARFLAGQVRELVRGDGGLARTWAFHLAGVAGVVAVLRVLDVPVWHHALGYTLGGAALTGLRAFAEHRPTTTGTRSAVVHASAPVRLLFLNNNLHHTHHAHPRVPWFELPAVHAAIDGDAAAAAGAGVWRGGYAELARRHLVRPLDHPVHPSRSA